MINNIMHLAAYLLALALISCECQKRQIFIHSNNSTKFNLPIKDIVSYSLIISEYTIHPFLANTVSPYHEKL